jgi:hypothetical protein
VNVLHFGGWLTWVAYQFNDVDECDIWEEGVKRDFHKVVSS